MSRYEYENKQESYSMHEKRSSWSSTYPSYEAYHVPPPTIQKMVTHHPFYYETSDEEDDHGHDHDHMAVINGRWNRHDEDGSRGWDNGSWYVNYNNHVENKNKFKGGILRPPLGSVSHVPSQQYHQHGGIDKVGQEVKNKNGRRYGEPPSRINHHYHHHNNNKNRVMEDYSRKYLSNYGKVLTMEDDDHARIIGSGSDEELDSLIKKLQRAGMVKKIEVVEYERNIYKGAREEWTMVNGNGNGAPNNNSPFMAKTYPNYKHTSF